MLKLSARRISDCGYNLASIVCPRGQRLRRRANQWEYASSLKWRKMFPKETAYTGKPTGRGNM